MRLPKVGEIIYLTNPPKSGGRWVRGVETLLDIPLRVNFVDHRDYFKVEEHKHYSFDPRNIDWERSTSFFEPELFVLE